MRAVEVAQGVRKTERVERAVQVSYLRVVVIRVANRGENREGRVARRRFAGRKTGTIQHDSRGAFAKHGDAGCDARAAGKAGEIDAAIVDGETHVGVIDHCLCSVKFGLPRAVLRVVGTDKNEAVAFRGVFHELHGNTAACQRIEEVNDGPALRGAVVRRQIQRVRLAGLSRAEFVRQHDTGLRRDRVGGRGSLLRAAWQPRKQHGAKC